MFQIRLVIAMLAAVVFLPGSSAAQMNSGDSGQYVILSAQYGTAQRHVDVTNRLKELARQDRTFRMGNSTFGVDPDKGQDKTLRIYARGPNGQERMFEYREGSTVDGSQFRSWGRGDWGQGGWNGEWEGGGYGGLWRRRRPGLRPVRHPQRAIRHCPATRGRHQPFEGAGPAGPHLPHGQQHLWRGSRQGQDKTLRIYARGPNGQERMFEYREGSTVDGSQFRSWGRGDWGQGGWNGGWDGGGREPQPEMTAALQNLREAQRNLQSASRDKGGHRANAVRIVSQAIAEVEAGIQYDNRH